MGLDSKEVLVSLKSLAVPAMRLLSRPQYTMCCRGSLLLLVLLYELRCYGLRLQVCPRSRPRLGVSAARLIVGLLELASPSRRCQKEIRLPYSFAYHGLELQRTSGDEEVGFPVSELVLSRVRRWRCDVCATVNPGPSPRTHPAEH
jgi:hypothetical protein